jgi:hypothetical protein
VLASLVVIAVNAALSARSPAPARQQAQQSYLDQALPAIQQSSQEGLDLSDVRAQALNLSAATMLSHVNGVATQARQTLNAVQKLNPPAPAKTAHALLVAALDIRYEATKALGPALSAALSGPTPDPGIQALASAGLDFQAGDRAYSLFQRAMPAVNPPLPASQWITDPATYSTDTLAVFVASLRSRASSVPVNDVRVLVVTTNPQPVNLQNGVEILPVVKQLNLQIVVANVGNQTEKNLTVSATIAPALFGPTQMVRDFVDLAPGQTQTVSLGGLRMVAGQPTTLTAKIDTAPGETNVADNSKVITLEMH